MPTRRSKVCTDLRTRMLGELMRAMICGMTSSHMSMSTQSQPRPQPRLRPPAAAAAAAAAAAVAAAAAADDS